MRSVRVGLEPRAEVGEELDWRGRRVAGGMRGVVSAWREPDAPDEVGAVGGFQLVIRRGERTPANRGRLVLPRRVPLWVEEPRLVALVHDDELVHGRECVRNLGGPGSELSDSRAVAAGLRISRRLAPVPV